MKNKDESILVSLISKFPYLTITTIILGILSLMHDVGSRGELYPSTNWYLILLIINIVLYIFRKPLIRLIENLTGMEFGLFGGNKGWNGMIEQAIINSNLHIEEEEEFVNMPTYEITETDYALTVVINGHLHKIEKDYEKAIPFFENALDLNVTEWKYERGRCTIVFTKFELEVDGYYSSKSPTDYLVLGIDPQQGEVRWEFNKFPHMLLIGAPGSGKSVMFKNVITQMEKDWELYFCDPKQVEFAELMYQGYRVAFDNDAIKQSIDDVVEVMEARYTLMREHRVVKYSDLPEDVRPKPCFLIIDEFGAFFSLLQRKEADEYGTKLRILVQKGRAAGVQCCLLTQKASSRVMDTDTRDTIACSVAMGNNRPDSYEMAFGAEGRQLKPLTIGEGYYNIGSGVRKMKTYNLSDEEFVEYTS